MQELKEGKEVYLLDSCGKKQFKAKYHPTDKESRIVHCRHLKDDEERFLITCVYKSNITNYDEDFHVEDTYIAWSTLCISRESTRSQCNREKDSATTSEKRARDEKYDTRVDIFWNHVQIAIGRVEKGICTEDIQQEVEVSMIFGKNVDNLKERSSIEKLHFKIGDIIMWPTKEMEVRLDDNIPLKKFARKETASTRAKKRKEEKCIKMTTFDDPIETCDCRDKCYNKIDANTQQSIREFYWTQERSGEYGDTNLFLSKLLNRRNKQRDTVLTSTRKYNRKYTVHYSLPTSVPISTEEDKVTVCKTMFLKTLGITNKKVTVVLKKKYDEKSMVHGHTGKASTHSTIAKDVSSIIRAHLSSFPTVPPHYRRKYTKNRYFEDDMTPKKMFDLFKTSHPTIVISLSSYKKVLNTFHIGFFKPKNDLCDECTKYNNSNKTEEDIISWNEHIVRKDACRSSKNADKERAKDADSKFAALIIDMEAVQNCPKARSGEFYYLSKISCYNLSCYHLKDDTKVCFMWDSTMGCRGSNEVGSCILHILRKLPKETEEVAIWADTCGGQNRNKENAAVLMYFLNEEVQTTKHKIKKITLKFFERGHNQSEVDTIHQILERANKNQEVFVPIRYKELARSAPGRKPIETFDLASNQYPVFDNHKLAEQSIVNRNRYRVIEDGKPIVKLASWKTAKQISFTRGSRSVSINCNADPESVGVLVDTSKKCYVHEKKELRSKKRQIFKLTNLYDDTTEIPVRQKVLLPLVKLCEKNIIPKEYQQFYKDLSSVFDGESDEEDASEDSDTDME